METFKSFAGPKWQLADSFTEVPDKIRKEMFAAMPELAAGQSVRVIAFADQAGLRGNHFFVLTTGKLALRTGTAPTVLRLSEIYDVVRKPRTLSLIGPAGETGSFAPTAKPSKELIDRLHDLLLDAKQCAPAVAVSAQVQPAMPTVPEQPGSEGTPVAENGRKRQSSITEDRLPGRAIARGLIVATALALGTCIAYVAIAPGQTDCEYAFEEASLIPVHKSTVTDLNLAVRVCKSVEEWQETSADFPNALNGGDPMLFLKNRCRDVVDAPLCRKLKD